MYVFDTDVAVLGAGPGGATASIFLSRENIDHVVLEKAVYPRDKVCGDALSGKVVAVLNSINPQIAYDFDKSPDYTNCWGVQFIAPNGRALDIPFRKDKSEQPYAPGFIAKRQVFDNYIFGLIDSSRADVRQGCTVKDVRDTGDAIEIDFTAGGEEKTGRAKIVIGAEGDRSVVAKKLAGHKMDRRYYAAGLRAYYKNVGRMHEQNFIELHYIKDVLPGYLWIFPLPNNEANVGIGLLSEKLENKSLNLKKMMLEQLESHPGLKQRFAGAELVDSIRGWGLPLGSIKRNLSGERFMLVGDAGSLIDPFTGEGIGNAMVSGRFAGKLAAKAIRENNYSAAFMKEYENQVYTKLWDELRLSYTIQRLVNFPWLFNFVVNHALRNKTVQETMSCMFEDLNMRAKLKSPGFYFKLLFDF